MAQVLIRNLPEHVVERLKQKAANENLSLEQYLRNLLHRETVGAKAEALERLRALRELGDPLPVSAPMPEDLIREDREHRARTVLDLPQDKS